MKVSGLLLERNSIKQLEQGSLDWTEMVKLFASDNFEGAVWYRPLGKQLFDQIIHAANSMMRKFDAVEVAFPTLLPKREIAASKRVELGLFHNFGIPIEFRNELRYLIPTHEEVAMLVYQRQLSPGSINQDTPDSLYFQCGLKYRSEDNLTPYLRMHQFTMHDLYTISPSKPAMENLFHRLVNGYDTLFQILGLKVHLSQMLVDPFFKSKNIEFLAECKAGADRVTLDKNGQPAKIDEGNIPVLEIGHIYMLDQTYNTLLTQGAVSKGEEPWYTATGLGIDRMVYVMLEQHWNGSALNFAHPQIGMYEAVIPATEIDYAGAYEYYTQKSNQGHQVLFLDGQWSQEGQIRLARIIGCRQVRWFRYGEEQVEIYDQYAA